MNFKHYIFYVILFLFIFSACQSQSGGESNQAVKIDSLDVSNLEIFISTESQLLGEPRAIKSTEKNRIAIYDHGYKKVLLFNEEGEQQLEFGQIGEGPGEWGEMSGAADLDYLSGQFFTTNRSQFIFNLYDSTGDHKRSIQFPKHLSNSDKKLLPNDKLLVATEGRKNSLAAILDLQENAEIIETIGSAESEYREYTNFEEQRKTYSEGDIPKIALNTALVAKGEEGYFVFMNALGELRHYTKDGEMNYQVEIPDYIRDPFFNFVVTQNKEVNRENSVTPLEYAKEIYVNNGLVYLFLPKPNPKVEDLNAQLLIFNSDGEFFKHFIFQDPERKSFLYDIAIAEDNSIYLIDIMNARVLKILSDQVN